MKTMRRIVTLLLALVMTASLAACGGGAEKIPEEAGDRTVIYYTVRN